MSSSESDFEQLMERVRGGDSEAARQLFEHYGPAIQQVVRRRLHRRLRTEFDSVDFVQDAWASFFDLPPERCTFRTPEELMAFLCRLVRNKVIDAHRKHFQTETYGRRKVQPLKPNSPDAQPTPSQVMMAEDEWQRLIRDKPPKLREAMQMMRAGHSRQEIAEELGLNPKRIQRLLQQLTEQITNRARSS
jgi:RNA polymerase sigma factor (sigma-70 family)